MGGWGGGRVLLGDLERCVRWRLKMKETARWGKGGGQGGRGGGAGRREGSV